jgi:hypothetical protein
MEHEQQRSEASSYHGVEQKQNLALENSTESCTETEKINLIRAACQAGDRAAVVEQAIRAGGLVSDEARKEACVSCHLVKSFCADSYSPFRAVSVRMSRSG